MRLWHELIPNITTRLTQHHALYQTQCHGVHWEEIFCQAMAAVGPGTNWQATNSHAVGVDQITASGESISNKGGTVSRKHGELTYSGSRTGKHHTLTEKLQFLSQDAATDYICCLATDKDQWQQLRARQCRHYPYYFIVIDGATVNYGHEAEWTETFKPHSVVSTGWAYKTPVFSATIRRSLSDQLWTTIRLDACQDVYEFTIG